MNTVSAILEPSTLADAEDPRELTMPELVALFGSMPFRRILPDPLPGTASEADAVELWERDRRLCELVQGVLVEKTVGQYESILAGRLMRILGVFVHAAKVGEVLSADAMMKLRPGLIRIPDASFVTRERLRAARIRPHGPVQTLVPNLAVEILSRGNTREEMDQKLRDYFTAGVELVWYVNPESQTVQAFTAPETSRIVQHPEALEGGSVLPGLSISLAELFAPIDDDSEDAQG